MRILLDNFTKKFDDVTVINNMNLEVRDGEMMALLGPSGCGKSTTLFSICGIYQCNGGRILFGERDVSHVTSQHRNVGVVFQNYALYPHMSIFDNIAFPLMVKKMPAEQIKKEVHKIAELVHIGNLLERKPSQLSGGQQQRVALSRALVRKPDVLLLDEPLANLDAKLRLEMRSEIRRIQQETGITAILVTHDQVEAMSMCDRIALMDHGKILQVTTPNDMYHNPQTDFVAGFLGNPPIAFLDGTIANGQIRLKDSAIHLPMPSRVPAQPDGKIVRLGVRPEYFGNEAGIELQGEVSFVETQGRENLYDVRLGNGAVLRSIQPVRANAALGDSVSWPLNTEQVLIFDEQGQRVA
ncbi:ABC transporter ATP-binding protein [Aliamphritea hakodatensis]|uniref:ABC transporter ATP-binding protein n=1 Tax=Aliamphritea hakodatensis TaxID=2895352 RepID=UPI0022FD59A8|nr:ABC transporter ATP-binding protein [Aliamphritea hakodatensis]